MPVQSTRIITTREEALRFPRGDIHLAYCWKCGFVTNVSFDPTSNQDFGRYTEIQRFSETYNAFQRKLASYLIDNYDLHGKKILEIACGQPVVLANDANCLALSEATDGAGAGAAVVFAAILGTGAGAGIAVHGRVLQGPHRLAGEWGHNPLPWAEAGRDPVFDCYCGQRGCIETLVSGSGLARDHDVIETTDARPDNTDRLVLYVRAFHNGRQYCRAERARQAGNEHKMIEE